MLKYPRLLILFFSLAIGFLLLTFGDFLGMDKLLDRLGYAGTFLTGLFFAHSFTFGPAVAAILANSQNQAFLWTVLVASFGAFLGNYLVFHFLKTAYTEETGKFFARPFFRKMGVGINRVAPNFVKSHLFPFFAGIVSATPLPDELTASLVRNSQNISLKVFFATAFVAHSMGIFLQVLLGRII